MEFKDNVTIATSKNPLEEYLRGLFLNAKELLVMLELAIQNNNNTYIEHSIYMHNLLLSIELYLKYRISIDSNYKSKFEAVKKHRKYSHNLIELINYFLDDKNKDHDSQNESLLQNLKIIKNAHVNRYHFLRYGFIHEEKEIVKGYKNIDWRAIFNEFHRKLVRYE